MLGINAVKAYVAAIVDLWFFWKSKGFKFAPESAGGGP
jgi:hypothetical protein